MSNLTNIRVIVPVFNSCEQLNTLLTHVATLPDLALENMVIVDDGSRDGTKNLLDRDFPQVTRLEGDGSLLWCGGMRLGMQWALDHNAQYIFWLNHDCRPDAGAVDKLKDTLKDPSIGIAGGFCRITGTDWPINPGFKSFQGLGPIQEGKVYEADGVNGNFVGFNAKALQQTGLPNAMKYPHYGDGPYTITIKRAGFRVVVNSAARADLDYEIERRLSPYWRVALSRKSTWEWLKYYLFSFKSQYHLKNCLIDRICFRGVMGLPAFLKKETGLLINIFLGAIKRRISSTETIVSECLHQYRNQWPIDKLQDELHSLTSQV